ncbi:hypothetical protein GmHk_17G048886 [Glycine max]|nr:hypothetical protein GmHk_17G048886 [Glycine max]
MLVRHSRRLNGRCVSQTRKQTLEQCMRQANTAAHSLAKAVVAYASPANLHHIPYCILEVINNEII